MQTIRKATSVLELPASNSEISILNGLFIPDQSMPVEDKTTNIFAGLSLLASRRNACRIGDDYLAYTQIEKNSGVSSCFVRLETFYGSSKMHDFGKSFNDELILPSAN